MTAWPSLATGTYRAILIDPPWPYDTRHNPTPHALARVEAGQQYSLMTMDDLCALPVSELAHRDGAVLFVWVTNRHLVDGRAAALVTAWGFTPKTLLTWRKTGQPGVGRWVRANTEHVILATIGHPPLPEAPLMASCFDADRPSGGKNRSHSRKPPVLADMVEQTSPGPYVELFQRQGRLGWDAHGWGHETRSAS